MGLAGDRGLEVVRGRSDGEASGRVAALLQVFQVPMGVAGLALSRGAEYRRDVVITLDIGLGGEIQIATVGLGLTGKGLFQITFSLTSFKLRHGHVLILISYN